MRDLYTSRFPAGVAPIPMPKFHTVFSRSLRGNPGPQPPTHELESVRFSPGEQQVPSQFETAGQPTGQLVCQVELVLRGCDSAFESPGASSDIIQVSLQIPLSFGNGFIFVDLDLKRILRDSALCKGKRDN